MADYYRDLVRWWNPKTGIRLIVDRKLRSRFTANGILKEAGIPKAF